MVNTRRNGQPNGDDEAPNFEAMIANALPTILPGLTTKLTTRITNDIRNGAGSSNGSGGGAPPTDIYVWIERFGKLKPLSFSSAATTTEAEDWITHMEKLFNVLGCTDNFKTRLATFKLEGNELNWWKAYKQAKGGEDFATTCTWSNFRDIFYQHYFPLSEQQRFEREYSSIYQFESEPSGEYMQRFLWLVSFVGPVAGDARRQARHFKRGLK
ncbi:zinc finger, CCHC-type, Retrotransposon gag domain protein [Artemisia annua]|uniref:Zinc finger, CCHC-type, Retrotransposon gag domain protein n=1 Tax=Artemisia annua TaxID=35608 RepID=A0A2U1KFK8_ARTAN|nr:zinc finger, CCHC-type, Retrotransposon gag domain protein [Artemisia annua]